MQVPVQAVPASAAIALLAPSRTGAHHALEGERGDVQLILRLFRGRASADRAADAAGALAGPFLDSARSIQGLASYAAGLRVDEGGVHFVIATTWGAVSDVVRQTRGELDRPARPLLPYMSTEGIEHFELIGEPMAIMVAPPDAVVRVAGMRIRLNHEEEFYATVRRGLAEVRPTGDLLAYHLGRRVEDGHRAAAVSVWRSVDALGHVVAPASGAPLWAEALDPLLDDFSVEHFDLIVARPT